MSNFYGGKQGFSFFIVKNFLTVEAMNAAFNSDPSVHFNDYVLVSDSANPYMSDNGKLYRKGYSEFEYMGRISGPPGGVSEIEFFESIEKLIEEYNTIIKDELHQVVPEMKNDEESGANVNQGKIIIEPLLIPGIQTIEDPEKGSITQYNNNIRYGYFNYITKDERDSIVGYSSSESEEDNIVKIEPNEIYNIPVYVAYANPNDPSKTDLTLSEDEIHTERYEKECLIKSQVKVALEIPYFVLDLEAETAQPGESVEVIDTTPIIEGTTPNFYKKYKVKIPQGANGNYYEITYDEETYTFYKTLYKYEIEDNQYHAQEPEKMGTLKDESGMLIGLTMGYYNLIEDNPSSTDNEYVHNNGLTHKSLVTDFISENNPQLVEDIAIIINNLNEDFPYGLGRKKVNEEITINDIDLHGKVIAYGSPYKPTQLIGEKEIIEKWIFGFDYSTKEDGSFAGWYYLGSLYSDYTTHNILFDESTSYGTPVNGNPLNIGGVWFRITSM